MDVRPIDPRDTEIEIDHPTYRVFFWRLQSDHPGSGYGSEEYELTGAQDIDEVLGWARANAGDDRTYTVYTVVGKTLVHLLGIDPTASSPGDTSPSP